MMPEASNNEQEGVGSDRLLYEADAMYAAVRGEEYGDTFHAVNWADKPHRVLYDAINLMRDSAATIAGLQLENAALKIDASNHAADAETVRRERDAESRRAKAAEAEVVRLREALEPFSQFRTAKMPGRYTDAIGEYFVPSDFEKARIALASTGGEHHGN